MIFLKNYFINTTAEVDVISIIHDVNRLVRDSKIGQGLVTVVVTQPGGALTILEPLPDLVEQFKEALAVFPGEGLETLSKRKEEIQVAPRIKAAMLGKTLHLPLDNGRLVLGPREEIVLVDFEKAARRREFYVQVMGEAPAAGQPPRRGAGPAGGRPPAGPRR
jgi:secondary thiamine-phosphate synthase enzyme